MNESEEYYKRLNPSNLKSYIVVPLKKKKRDLLEAKDYNSWFQTFCELSPGLLQYGEIDCWQMECPPVTCSNPVTEEGDCCPRCEDDPCAREVPVNGTSLTVPSRPRPCSYGGIVHDSGSSWQDPHDKCTTCECKVRRRIGRVVTRVRHIAGPAIGHWPDPVRDPKDTDRIKGGIRRRRTASWARKKSGWCS